jgi:hypothetical protein
MGANEGKGCPSTATGNTANAGTETQQNITASMLFLMDVFTANSIINLCRL